MNTSSENVGWGVKLGHTGRSKVIGEYVIKKSWLMTNLAMQLKIIGEYTVKETLMEYGIR